MCWLLVMALALFVSSCGDGDGDGDGRSTSATVAPSAGATPADTPAPPEGVDTASERAEALLDELRQPQSSDVQPPDVAALIRSANLANEQNVQATTQYLDATIRHADRVWSAWFTANGLREPVTGFTIVQPGQTYRSRCDDKPIDSNFDNAFYCPLDSNSVGDGRNPGQVILPVQTMARMWTGDIFSRHVDQLKRTGDFSAGIIAAHEFGHNVADELSQQLGRLQPGKPSRELLADCFAGVWAYSVFLDNYLEEGDIDEAVDALAVIGDDIGDHGTGPQRDDAFLIGYKGTLQQPGGGVPARCLENYWR